MFTGWHLNTEVIYTMANGVKTVLRPKGYRSVLLKTLKKKKKSKKTAKHFDTLREETLMKSKKIEFRQNKVMFTSLY